MGLLKINTLHLLSSNKTGQLDKNSAKLYSHLFDWRQETDYADFIEFDAETVKPLLTEVKELNKKFKNLIEIAKR